MWQDNCSSAKDSVLYAVCDIHILHDLFERCQGAMVKAGRWLTSCRLATRNRRQDFVQLASREACFKPFLRCLCALHVCSWRTSEKPAESHEPRDCWHTATFGVSKMSNHRLRSFPLPRASYWTHLEMFHAMSLKVVDMPYPTLQSCILQKILA